MCVLEPDPEVGNCLGEGLHWYCLNGLHTTNRVIACSLICNRNLACDKGARLNYCGMISVVGELGVAIITPGRLYFMLSCRLAPIDVTALKHGRCAVARPHGFDQVTPSAGVGLEVFWARLFSGPPV
jgi:hypothetical protein